MLVDVPTPFVLGSLELLSEILELWPIGMKAHKLLKDAIQPEHRYT